MKVSKLRRENTAVPTVETKTVPKAAPRPRNEVDVSIAAAKPADVDPVFNNPEFRKPVDELVALLDFHFTQKRNEVYDRDKVIAVATKLIEARA